MPGTKESQLPDYQECATFRVKKHRIIEVNEAAARLRVTVGTNIREIICVGAQEYENFDSGELHLTICVAGEYRTVCVTKEEGCYQFRILSDYSNAELKSMALAGMYLISPLQDAITSARSMAQQTAPEEATELKKTIGQLNCCLYRIMRSVKNMTDASVFRRTRNHNFQYCELSELFGSAAAKLTKKEALIHRRIFYSGPQRLVYTMADKEALERAFYNMISNAVIYSPEGSIITIKVTADTNRAYVTVTNAMLPESLPIPSFFNRYQRTPGLDDASRGIGLGVTVIRNIASLHRGTLLIEPRKDNSVSVSMSIALSNTVEETLRSPFNFEVVQCGGFDIELIELSGILPSSSYEI